MFNKGSFLTPSETEQFWIKKILMFTLYRLTQRVNELIFLYKHKLHYNTVEANF